MADQGAFEAEWPYIEKRLHRSLWHRRVPPPVREDLVQETGLRLFKVWDRVDPDRDPWPLALTIALNALRDQIRMDFRQQSTEFDDALIEPDAETAALARIELGRVHDALGHLTAPQRSALLAEVGVGAVAQESPAAQKMLRFRARKRLRGILDGASGFAGVVGLATHRSVRAVKRWVGAGEQLAAYAPVAAGVLCMAALSGASWPPPIGSESSLQASMPYRLVTFNEATTTRALRNLASYETTAERTYAASTASASSATTPVAAPSQGGTSLQGVHVDDPHASVGPDGYELREVVVVAAAGHSTRTLVESRAHQDTDGIADGGWARRGQTPSGLAEPEIRASQEVDGRRLVSFSSKRIKPPR